MCFRLSDFQPTGALIYPYHKSLNISKLLQNYNTVNTNKNQPMLQHIMDSVGLFPNFSCKECIELANMACYHQRPSKGQFKGYILS